MEIMENNFELLLAQKNHKELIKKLDEVLKELIQNGNSTSSIDLSGIEESISNINLKSQTENIPTAILALGDVIVSKIKDLEVKQITEWVFNIERNSEGYIEKVKANGIK